MIRRRAPAYFAQSDPAKNPQFNRRWHDAPPRRHVRHEPRRTGKTQVWRSFSAPADRRPPR